MREPRTRDVAARARDDEHDEHDRPDDAAARRVLLKRRKTAHQGQGKQSPAPQAPGHAASASAPPVAARATLGPRSPLDELAASNHTIETELVPLWQRAVDGLDLAMLTACSRRAVTLAGESEQLAQALVGTPQQRQADALVEQSRALWSELATLRFGGEVVHGPRATLGPSVADFLNERYLVTSRCIDAGARILAACRRRVMNDDGVWELEPADAMLVAQLLNLHSDALEQGFLWKVLRQTGHARMVHRVGGIFGAVIEGAERAHVDEAAATHGWKDDLAPDRLAYLHTLADEISGAVASKKEGASAYVDRLHQVSNPEKGALVRMLQTRGLLHDMVRLGGQPVLFAIRHGDGFAQWRYDEDLATVEPEKTVWKGIKGAARNLPGATAHFTASVYRGLSDVPIVGSVAKRAADNLDELRDYADDEMGVSEDERALRDKIAGTAGAVDAIILKTAVVAESGAGSAATAFNAARGAKAGYDAYTTAEKLAGMIGELREGWATAKNGWGLFTATLNELSGTVNDVLLDEVTGDPKQTEHVLDHVSALFDIGIKQLGGTVGEKVTESGRKKAAGRATADQKRADQQQQIASRAASPQLKIELELLAAAHRQAAAAQTEEEQAIAHQEMQHHADRVRELATPESFGNAALVEGQMAADKRRKDEEDEEAKQKGEGFKGGLKRLGHSLGEEIKEALLDFGVAALSSAKDQVMEQLKAHLLEGKPLDLKARRVIAKAVAKGASSVAVDRAGEFVRGFIGKLIHRGVEALIAEHYPGLEGLADVLDGPIEDLLKHLEKELDVDHHVEEPIESLVLKLFGVGK